MSNLSIDTLQQFTQILSLMSQSGEINEYGQKCSIINKSQSIDTSNIQDLKQQLKNYIDQQYQLSQEKLQSNSLTHLSAQPKCKRLYVDGCFDLMHSGHFNALRQAKSLCETLVVGVISHEEVCKRKGTPILSYEERLTLAKSCKWVDEIYENAPYDATLELLEQLDCSHTAHGDDMIIGPNGEDAYKKFKDVGKMIVYKRTEGISTTDIVGRLLLMTNNQNENLNFKKKIRKLSNEQGVQASKLDEQDLLKPESGELQEQQQEVEQQIPVQITKVKLLNTSRRIRQFSSDHQEPKEGDKIVYIDGSFDVLHLGHIKGLEAAKKQGDYLIVGIHDDETINQIKGNNYPILQLQERVLNVLALKYVDEVIIGAPYKVTEQMIKQFNIDIVVEGTQTENQKPFNDHINDCPYQIPKDMGIFRYVDSQSVMTIDTIIERIFNHRMQYLQIYNKKAKKQQDYYDQNKNEVKEQ